MKKILLLALSPFILLTITFAGNKLPYIANVTSNEHDSITSEFTLQIKFYSLDTLTVFDIESQLPENWTMTNISTFPQTFVSNDSTVFSINIQLPNTINLPYYPQSLKFYIHTDTDTTNSTPIIAKIYFTPYNTIEIWNIEDFYSLPREWLNEEDVAPVRSFIAKSAIPVSDIMDLSVYQKDSTNWDDYDFDNFREIDVPGLAYRVLMSPPDSITRVMLDSIGGGIEDTTLTRKTYTGTVSGRNNYNL
ncbi:hypothetical protein FACS1894178_1870 [Bacteroidia bacterium]|nr:hypothetical protein FACS1894178_1870 [Bacteroidia bacterium]